MRFVRRWAIPAATPGSPRPWLEGISLASHERAQLLAIVRLLDPSFDESTLETAAHDALASANGVVEVPVEAWDVEHDEGGIAYQLWLFCADAGALFRAGTTQRVAEVSQCAFWGDETLASELERARTRAPDARGSELAKITFGAR